MNNVINTLISAFKGTLRPFSVALVSAATIALALITPDVIWPMFLRFFSINYSFFGAFGVSIVSAFFLLLTFEVCKISYAMIKPKKDPNDKVTFWNFFFIGSSLALLLSFFIWLSSFMGMILSPFPLGDNYIFLRHIAFFSSFTPAPFFIYKTMKVLLNDIPMAEDMPAPITIIFVISCIPFYQDLF